MNTEKLNQLGEQLHQNPPELLSPPFAHLFATYHLLDAAIDSFNQYAATSGKTRFDEEIHDVYADLDDVKHWVELMLKRDYGVDYGR